MSQGRIYLDHNATTPMGSAAADRMRALAQEDFGNPSSLHWAGAGAEAIVAEARRQVGELVGARGSEVVFTGGGTEADVTALWSMAMAARRRDPGRLPALAYLRVEHPAIVEGIGQLEALGLARGVCVEVDGRGQVVEASLREAAAVSDGLCAMWANNETGALLDLELVAAVVAEAGIPWHCDAVQAVGKVPIDLARGPARQITTLAVAAHKLYGPKGVGALIVRRGAELVPLLPGGAQEGGRRSGTLNVPGIAAFGIAASEAGARLAGDPTGARVGAWRDRLQAAILGRHEGSAVNGEGCGRLPNTLNVSIMGPGGEWADGEGLMLSLSAAGIAVSTGAACSAGSRRPSRILSAMGLEPARCHASLRVSFGHTNDEGDGARLLDALGRALAVG